jgi:hypothetical protein
MNGNTDYQEARNEATKIEALSGKRPLRLHVVGDATSDETARLLSDAAFKHSFKGGQPVWTYTHGWRNVSRYSWGTVNVLASCENMHDVRDAWNRQYAACLTVPEHESKMSYWKEGFRVIPCPQQTVGVKCTDCRLCFNDMRLRKNRQVIAFEAHGAQKKVVQRTLRAVNDVNAVNDVTVVNVVNSDKEAP